MNQHQNHYRDDETRRCERALVTLIGDIGPWANRVVLVGGLAPRYLATPELGATEPHIGTSDVDLVIGLAIGNTAETYATLQTNLNKSGFRQSKPSYQWSRDIDGVSVKIEFLCETTDVAPGEIYRPRAGTGSKMTAFNVRGAELAVRDFLETTIEAERLNDGGLSAVTVRIAGILPYVVLKIRAFQDRHNNKDAYDLIYVLNHIEGGPTQAGRNAAESPIAADPLVIESIDLFADRFATNAHDGPVAYADFTGYGTDPQQVALHRNLAVATAQAFVNGFRSP